MPISWADTQTRPWEKIVQYRKVFWKQKILKFFSKQTNNIPAWEFR